MKGKYSGLRYARFGLSVESPRVIGHKRNGEERPVEIALSSAEGMQVFTKKLPDFGGVLDVLVEEY